MLRQGGGEWESTGLCKTGAVVCARHRRVLEAFAMGVGQGPDMSASLALSARAREWRQGGSLWGREGGVTQARGTRRWG